MSAAEAMKASHGRRWIVAIQRVQKLLLSWCGVLRRRASRPGLPIRRPKNVRRAGSSVSDAASTSSTATEEETASP